MAAYKLLERTILTQYWGQVTTFIIAISVMFALFLAFFNLIGQ